jgi:hypothetical protein
MEFHEIANVWPLMTDDALTELANDIRANGLMNPIWLYEGKVLDGRNRWTACIMAGVKPTTKEYTGDNPTAFAVSMNDKRRHMNKGQLGAIAVELLPFFEKDAKRRQVRKPKEDSVPEKIPEQNHGTESRQQAAKSVGVNDRYVSDAKKVKQEAPEVFEKLKAGKITMQDAKREVAKKPTDDWRKDERSRQKEVQNGVCVVANQNADKNLILWAENQGKAVRIDRSSKYGNPFILDQDGDRDFVCDCFENHYLPHKPSIEKDIPKLKGKVLVCHCFPNRCHGDTLAKLANEQ